MKLETQQGSRPRWFSRGVGQGNENVLTPKLKDTFNHVLKTGITPPSWREAVISLIPKEGKDKLDCGSYPPISVLNQDYNIFTHVLAKRIEKSSPR